MSIAKPPPRTAPCDLVALLGVESAEVALRLRHKGALLYGVIAEPLRAGVVHVRLWGTAHAIAVRLDEILGGNVVMRTTREDRQRIARAQALAFRSVA